MKPAPNDCRRLIESRLKTALKPLFLEVVDESRAHEGHSGAQHGGGHFFVDIVSDAFQGKTLKERHQMVYRAVEDLMQKEIHALRIRARPQTKKEG